MVKPLDFGGGGVNGSLDAQGRIIALNFYHPVQGYVTMTTAEPFPEDQRYLPAAVRAYRNSLSELAGAGIYFNLQPVESAESRMIENAIPQIRLAFNDGGSALVTTWAERGGAIQQWKVEGAQARWGGKLAIQRCAYTQLTEGGPLPAPPMKTRVYDRERLLIIENEALGSAVAISGLLHSEGLDIAADDLVSVGVPAPESEFTLVYGVGSSVEEAIGNARSLASSLATPQSPAPAPKPVAQGRSETVLLDSQGNTVPPVPSGIPTAEKSSDNVGIAPTGLDAQKALWRKRWEDVPDEPLVRRGLVYGLSMGIPVNLGVCILTDHMLLPLSWNRDAYYVARALLSWRREAADLVRQHLVWLFEIAERPDNVWGRCYLANGKVKDPAYQLDQQLYPLLELVDYTIATGDAQLMSDYLPQVNQTLDALMTRKAGFAPLFSTDETPADDPIAQPYHLSSHLLLWRTLKQLQKLGIDREAALASELEKAIPEYFISLRDGISLYAYATDGHGSCHFYHDANDLPFVLAPDWGLIDVNNAAWKATIDFAFSEANTGGCYGGRLGSVHTRAAWALGDVQDLIVARLRNDPARAERAWTYLRKAAQPDGSLPEAYDAETGEVVSRHWFAWPSAALACEVLGAFKG